jgi:hypothetical protein
MRKTVPPPGEVTPDAPLRLAIAAAIAYPDGSMTASGLRREAARGNLAIERTAGKDYTTLAAIREMREKCRLRPKGRASTSGASGATPQAKSPDRPSTSSETVVISAARDAAEPIFAALRKRSPSTSEKGGSRRKALVIPLRSR